MSDLDVENPFITGVCCKSFPDEDDTQDEPGPIGVLPAEPEVDVEAIKFVLDSIIDFIEDLKLTGDTLQWGGQLLRDVEALRHEL